MASAPSVEERRSSSRSSAGARRGDRGWRKWFRRATSLVGTLLVLLCFAVAAVPLYGQLTGRYRLLPVLSGSMAPVMERGDLAWVEPKPLAELKVGDVLVFNSPARGSTPSRRTIHRVIELVDPERIRATDAKPGTVYVRTKGDANQDPDPWIAAIGDPTVWVQTKVIYDLGRPILATESRNVRVAFPLVGAALFAAWGGAVLLRKDPEPRDAADADPRPAPPLEPQPVARPRHLIRPAAVGLAALVVGAGGLTAAVTAALYDRETEVGTIGAGSVRLGTGPSTLSLVVANLLPGQSVERVFDLTNDGSLPLGSLDVEVTGDQGPLLDPAGGLQLEVSRCAQAWQVASGAGQQPSVRCPSTPTTVIADRPVIGRTSVDRQLVDVDEPGGVDHLRVAVRLPESAPPSLAGQQGTMQLAFVAGQRTPSVR